MVLPVFKIGRLQSGCLDFLSEIGDFIRRRGVQSNFEYGKSWH